MRPLWHTFESSLQVYLRSSVEGAEDSYDGRYDSDGEEKSLDTFVIQVTRYFHYQGFSFIFEVSLLIRDGVFAHRIMYFNEFEAQLTLDFAYLFPLCSYLSFYQPSLAVEDWQRFGSNLFSFLLRLVVWCFGFLSKYFHFRSLPVMSEN